jgi:tetratricopeptide (TPR) repeat protein
VKHRLASVFPWHGGVATLFTDPRGKWDHKEYGLAWALVHYLKNAQPAGFADLQGRFARGQDPEAAWREVFPQWDPARAGGLQALDDALGRYVAYGKFGYRDVILPEERPATSRPVGAAAAHAVRLELLPWINRGKPLPPGAVEAEVAEALRHDPGHVTALRVRALREKDAAARLALAEQAVAAHPEDGRAWGFLGSALPEGDARRLEAYGRAAALLPEDGTALNNHAWNLLAAGRSGEALPLARAAVVLEPWSAFNLDTLASVLDDLGQCPAALPVQRRACDLLGEGYSAEDRKELEGRLAALEKQCGPKPAPAASPGAPAPAPASP